MATATVIHFGRDDFNRIELLQRVGFEVLVLNSLEQLPVHLKDAVDTGEPHVDAVLVSEETPESAVTAAAFIRQHSDVPLILLRRSEAALDESRFDRVYDSHVAPSIWLYETAVVVEQSQMLRRESEDLRAQSKAARESTKWQRARSRLQLSRNARWSGGLWDLDDEEKK